MVALTNQSPVSIVKILSTIQVQFTLYQPHQKYKKKFRHAVMTHKYDSRELHSYAEVSFSKTVKATQFSHLIKRKKWKSSIDIYPLKMNATKQIKLTWCRICRLSQVEISRAITPYLMRRFCCKTKTIVEAQIASCGKLNQTKTQNKSRIVASYLPLYSYCSLYWRRNCIILETMPSAKWFFTSAILCRASRCFIFSSAVGDSQ